MKYKEDDLKIKIYYFWNGGEILEGIDADTFEQAKNEFLSRGYTKKSFDYVDEYNKKFNTHTPVILKNKKKKY